MKEPLTNYVCIPLCTYIDNKFQRQNVINLRLNQLLQRHTRAIPAVTATAGVGGRSSGRHCSRCGRKLFAAHQANGQVRIGRRDGPRLAPIQTRALGVRQVVIREHAILVHGGGLAASLYEVAAAALRALPRLTASHVPLGTSLDLGSVNAAAAGCTAGQGLRAAEQQLVALLRAGGRGGGGGGRREGRVRATATGTVSVDEGRIGAR